jgi:hypothetical protein
MRHFPPRKYVNGGSGRLACRMPASWRGDCHATGSGVPPGTAESSQRDSAAAGGSAQDDVIFNEPGRGKP